MCPWRFVHVAVRGKYAVSVFGCCGCVNIGRDAACPLCMCVRAWEAVCAFAALCLA